MPPQGFRGPDRVLAFALAMLVALAACSPTTSPTATQETPTPGASLLSQAPAPSASEAATQGTTSGFAFDAESVVGSYQNQGYTCGSPQPSTVAAGYLVTTCQLADSAGRTLVIGVVTDPTDELADGFASVRGTASETILDPAVALAPLAGFLGAMLGRDRGELLLPWLASHHGDAYAETRGGDLLVTTYLNGTDHSTIFVEVASPAYRIAAGPSPS
jgi:hypothetical protein